MKYYELTFYYDSPTDVSMIGDVLAAELGAIGFESFVQGNGELKAYVSADKFHPGEVDVCLAHFPLPGIEFRYEQVIVDDIDWNEEWEKNYFKPIRIGRECLIRASFHPTEKGFEHEIIIDPKMAFGTGNHATTFLMIREMLKLNLEGKSLLDMGCGTAVLAILGAMKRAGRVVAIDIDEWAYDNAVENCRLNGMEDVEVALGGAEQIARFGVFDYIFANINRNILLADMRHYVPTLRVGGTLYMSGFYEEDIPVMEKECNANGLHLVSFEERDHWIAMKTVREW